MIKYAINPETLEIKSQGETPHYRYLTCKSFDKWVRCIYFPEYSRIYFRFYKPSGDYNFISDIDDKRSRLVCSRILSHLVDNRLIRKTTKVLFWDTDKVIDGNKIRP